MLKWERSEAVRSRVESAASNKSPEKSKKKTPEPEEEAVPEVSTVAVTARTYTLINKVKQSFRYTLGAQGRHRSGQGPNG